MNGFEKALDGYYDVEDQLARYLLDRADEHFVDERATESAIDDRSTFEERRASVREQFRANLGGLPERPADPTVDRTGRIEQDGYAVELLAFESRPDFHVTANCYVPDGAGPHPGVLFLCGHVDWPKSDPSNQRACIELVKNGFVVLLVNPFGQGDRRQYFDAETGDPRFGGGGGVFPHSYAGQRCLYAGGNVARYLVHDDRCALDHLIDRPDVDGDRIGVVGTSLGGIQTQYLALLDDRVDAAAPCCSVTTRREWLKTGKRIGAEQVVYGAIPRGIDYDDFLTARAPDPLYVGAAASDQYFPVEGVHETVERTRRVYDLYDARDQVTLDVVDETHCSVYELGDGPFEFLCDHLGDGAYDPVDDHQILDRSELHVAPDGRIVEAHENERTVDDLIREFVADRHPDPDPAPSGGDAASGETDDGLGAALVDAFALDRSGCDLHPRFVDHPDETEPDDLSVDHVWFRTERDPDVVVAGVLVRDPGAAVGDPAVVLYEDGTEELPGRSDELAALARERGAAFAFDPRGVGAVRNREIHIHPWVDEYDAIYGTEFKLAYDAMLLGDPLLGQRTYDVLRAMDFLRSEVGTAGVSLVGHGTGRYHALYAAVVDGDVSRIDLQGRPRSFRELATGTGTPFRPELTAFDVVGRFDVPRVTAALEGRGVSVVEEEASR